MDSNLHLKGQQQIINCVGLLLISIFLKAACVLWICSVIQYVKLKCCLYFLKAIQNRFDAHGVNDVDAKSALAKYVIPLLS